MAWHDVPGWLPSSLIALVAALVVIITMRNDLKHLSARVDRFEKSVGKKLDTMTPRMAELSQLRADVDFQASKTDEVRDALLLSGHLTPQSRPRHRTRTPPHGSPAPPVTRESDDDDPT